MAQDARTESYFLVDMDGYICLFTNLRLDRYTVPEDLYCYDVRDADCDGCFAEIQSFVCFNHWGTIITKEPIPMNEYHCYWPEREEAYLPPNLALEYYQNSSIAKLVAPYLSAEERTILGETLEYIPDDLFRIRHKPYLQRSGEEQERLAAFCHVHTQETGTSAAAFLGMPDDAYHAWMNGTLALTDGSRHLPAQEGKPSFAARVDSAASRTEDHTPADARTLKLQEPER